MVSIGAFGEIMKRDFLYSDEEDFDENPFPPSDFIFYENPFPLFDPLFYRNPFPPSEPVFFRNGWRLRPLELGIGLLSVLAIGFAVAMYARMAVGTAVRRHPGPGRTAVIGDSIVAHSVGFVSYLDRYVPERSFENFGVIGQGTSDIHQDLRNRVIGQGFDEVIIEGGMNDLGRADAVSYVTNNLAQMVREARAAGLYSVLLTITPWEQAHDSISQINRIILSQGRQWGADVVVDVHSPLADYRGFLRGEYSGDRVNLHPNVTGQRVIGEAIQAAAYIQ